MYNSPEKIFSKFYFNTWQGIFRCIRTKLILNDLLFYEIYVANYCKFNFVLKIYGNCNQPENFIIDLIKVIDNVQFGAYGQN